MLKTIQKINLKSYLWRKMHVKTKLQELLKLLYQYESVEIAYRLLGKRIYASNKKNLQQVRKNILKIIILIESTNKPVISEKS